MEIIYLHFFVFPYLSSSLVNTVVSMSICVTKCAPYFDAVRVKFLLMLFKSVGSVAYIKFRSLMHTVCVEQIVFSENF